MAYKKAADEPSNHNQILSNIGKYFNSMSDEAKYGLGGAILGGGMGSLFGKGIQGALLGGAAGYFGPQVMDIFSGNGSDEQAEQTVDGISTTGAPPPTEPGAYLNQPQNLDINTPKSWLKKMPGAGSGMSMPAELHAPRL